MENNVAAVGRVAELKVVEISSQGAFVDAGTMGSLFVPRRQLPKDLAVGSLLPVFLYVDGGRVLATGRRPYLQLGMVGRLRITEIDCGTVYLDMGIPKELVLPISEQKSAMEVGREIPVYVAIDDLGRLFATQRFNRYIRDVPQRDRYRSGDEVVICPVARTPLGYRAVVNDEVYGLLYRTEIRGEVVFGRRYHGFIAGVRPDGKLDVTLNEPGRSGVEHAAEDILKALVASKGNLTFNDRTPAEVIEDYLHMSKGRFKKAIGHLYKERLIEINDDGISLTALGSERCGDRQGSDQNSAP